MTDEEKNELLICILSYAEHYCKSVAPYVDAETRALHNARLKAAREELAFACKGLALARIGAMRRDGTADMLNRDPERIKREAAASVDLGAD